MTETTTEQLAEIEGQAEDTPATEYTPPEGWRVLQVGEALREGDVTVRADGYQYPTERVGSVVGAKQRYIRRIEPQPEPEPIQVREGRWRTRGGQEFRVSPMPTDHWDFAPEYPWWDGHVTTWRTDGRFSVHQNAMDLVEYLGPIEPQPEPVPQAESDADERIRLLKQANDSQAETIGRLLSEARDLNMEIGGLERQLLQRDARIRDLETMHAAAAQAVVDAGKGNDKLRAQADELRSEVSYVQNLLGTERRRVAELEELVASLRTINVTQEKAFTAAGKENTALRNQLAAVKAELASVAADRQQLRVELDAAQQVPQAIADRFEEGWNQGTARAVETVIAWLEPIRLADSAYLANATMQHLPSIMRHLTGLAQD